MPRIAWILLSVAIAGLVVVLAGAAFLIGTGSGTDARTGTTAGTTPPLRLQLPLASDPRALMLAQERKPLLIGLAAKPRGPVEVAVLDGEREVQREALSFSVDGRSSSAEPCGYACSRLDTLVLDGKRRVLSVAVAGRGSVSFHLPAQLPSSGAVLFRRVQRAMHSLRSYRYGEFLSSGVGKGVRTRYEARAPDRLRLSASFGRTIIIGRTRWDNVGGRWQKSVFPGLSTRSFMWDGGFNARLVGTHVLTAFDFRPVPAWFRLTIGPDSRVLEAHMIAPSHFMTQRFSRFNGPLRIEPPR